MIKQNKVISPKEIKNRMSNFELLRIIAVFFVVLHHLLIKGASTCGYTHPYSCLIDGLGGVFLNSLVIIGVNVFVLISGWFGIKKVYPQIIRLIFDCVIYGMITNIFCFFVFDHVYSSREFVKNLSFTGNWYIVSFIMLILLAPMLEKAIKNALRKELVYWIGLLSIFNVVFGYCLGNLNVDGYNVLNFMYLYAIGRGLKLYSHDPSYKKVFKWGILYWLMCAVILLIGFLVFTNLVSYRTELVQKYFGYNNPVILLSSIAFFAWFSLLDIRSKWINRVACGVLGVYLLHTTFTLQPYRNEFAGHVYVNWGYPGIFLLSVLIFFLCLMISVVVEWMKVWMGQVIRKRYFG